MASHAARSRAFQRLASAAASICMANFQSAITGQFQHKCRPDCSPVVKLVAEAALRFDKHLALLPPHLHLGPRLLPNACKPEHYAERDEILTEDGILKFQLLRKRAGRSYCGHRWRRCTDETKLDPCAGPCLRVAGPNGQESGPALQAHMYSCRNSATLLAGWFLAACKSVHCPKLEILARATCGGRAQHAQHAGLYEHRARLLPLRISQS